MGTEQRLSTICFNCQALTTGKNCLSSKLMLTESLESTA
ncbi:hypothetical protein LEMLEM_LOCUS11568 [Lemmus lemmus]